MMTDDNGLWRHHAKIEQRLIAEAEGIRQDVDDRISLARKTIRSIAQHRTAPETTESARPRLVLVVSRKSEDPESLYWSRDGIVACTSHAPRPVDPRFRVEDWRQVRDGRWYLQCQICHGTPIRPARSRS